MSEVLPLTPALVLQCVVLATVPCFAAYFSVGLFFELGWYRRRAEAESWKCQPDRWPDRATRIKEVRLAAAALLEASLLTAVMMVYVATGGRTALYFDLSAHGPLFTLASALGYFLLSDLLLFAMHRMLHIPVLYRAFHRTHHQFLAPTAMSMAALHPVELALLWSCLVLPSLVVPVHVGVLAALAGWHLLVGMIDHSGVRLHSRLLSWMEPSQFHDDHHRYFHVNFGQTLGTWDRLFGTARRVGNRYSEDDFSPLGRRLDGADPRRAPYLDYRSAGGPVREPEVWAADRPAAPRG